MMGRIGYRLTVLAGGILLALLPEKVLGLDPTRTLSQYVCRSWTREEGLPANGISAIRQTQDGYLWLGTQKGLVRFDGVEFSVAHLPINRYFRFQSISALCASRGGGLWFGIQNGAFGHYSQAAGFTTLPGEDSLDAAMNVATVYEAADGSLWVGAAFSLNRYVSGHTNLTQSFADGRGFITIFEDAHHRIWLGSIDQKLHYWEDNRFHTFADANLTNEIVFAMAQDLQGQLWLGTQLGLHCYDASLRHRQTSFSAGQVRALLVDRHGALWIGTAGKGLWRYKDGSFSSFTKEDGLINDDVTALLEDHEGSLWVGTRDGLCQLSDLRFPLYGKAEGFPDKTSFHGVCASSGGGLWVASGAGISYYDGQQTLNYSREAGLHSTWIKIVFEARDHDLYLINGDREVEIFSDGQVVARYGFNGRWPTALAEDAQGVVVAVKDSLYRVSRKEMKPYPFQSGQAPSFRWIRNLASGRDGSILVGSVNGMYRLKNGAAERLGPGDGLPVADVLYLCEDDDGVIWGGLAGGLARVQGNRIDAFTREEGLFDTYISAIVPDRHGWLWIQSGEGIFRVSLSSIARVADHKASQLECIAYDDLASVKTTETADVEHSACRTADGRIWFPSPLGLVCVDPGRVPTNSSSPLVHIQRVRINDVDCLRSSPAVMPLGKGGLEVQFTAATFITPQKAQFRYQLEGYETNWIDAGTRRSAFFTNLKPGAYRFRVQACNADGIWGRDMDSFSVRLLPPYYQTAWFRLCCGLLAVSALAGGCGWRVAHLNRKQRKLQETNVQLESRVQERTRELAEQRNLLRTLIDNLPDHFFVKDTQGRVVIANTAHARMLGVASPEEAVGKTDLGGADPALAAERRAQEQAVLERGEIYNGEETLPEPGTGAERWYQTTKVPLRDAEGRITGLAGIRRDITERKEWEERLQTLHKQLVEASRQAGMADVATNVLHNVGNVLNSVNISGGLLEEKLKHLAGDRLGDLAALLRQHEHELGCFLTADPKGRTLPHYLDLLAQRWQKEKSELLEETRSLLAHLEHVKQVVSMQQSYARAVALEEIVAVHEIIEDALRLNALSHERHRIQIVREFSPVPQLCLDRHQLMQILVNLLQNAEKACLESGREPRSIAVRLGLDGADFVQIRVKDNGIGIAPENLIRIFSHGFTTFKNGHGFGLHSGALAAQQMGGTLKASSPGLGQGAVFVLRLPVRPAPRSAPAREPVLATVGAQ